MSISAKVVAHSRAPGAPDLITLQLRYPRMIHSEFMTHRVFSRNASSSRAIPIERMIQDVIDDPAMPVAWGSNKPGMQAGEECTHTIDLSDDVGGFEREEAWLIARDRAVEVARGFAKADYHKQIVNRLLEPFGHISVVCTATEWDNFFTLRCHPDADPTMRALAEAMRDAIAGSRYDVINFSLERSGMHLPYISMADIEDWPVADRGTPQWSDLAMISAARCARVSYLTHSGDKPDIEKDLILAKKLIESKHASPMEHQARVGNRNQSLWRNFNGWEQHRAIIGL